ncbi:hypothetical protein [Flavobacterium beibuense]|uniref:hypothetical protein n=1 Tax=Flavobacterium beibuense TaxID=657326 RepID=UPI003A90EA93
MKTISLLSLLLLLVSCKKDNELLSAQNIIHEQSIELAAIQEGIINENYNKLVEYSSHYNTQKGDSLLLLKKYTDSLLEILPKCNRQQSLELYNSAVSNASLHQKKIKLPAVNDLHQLNDVVVKDVIKTRLLKFCADASSYIVRNRIDDGMISKGDSLVAIRLNKYVNFYWNNNSHMIMGTDKFTDMPHHVKLLIASQIVNTINSEALNCENESLPEGDLAFLVIDKTEKLPLMKILNTQLDVYPYNCPYPLGLFQAIENDREGVSQRVIEYLNSSQH